MNLLVNISNESNYDTLKEYRHAFIKSTALDHNSLQSLHEKLIKQVVKVAITQIESEWGPPPTPFTFFVLGSAGRSEQGVISDQDHGLIYHKVEKPVNDTGIQTKDYFIKLGIEISTGLSIVGYEECDGKIMASNPKWCLSEQDWLQQIETWLEHQDWASIRHLLILFDGEAIVGAPHDIQQLKVLALEKINSQTALFDRLTQNTNRVKKFIGLFGQFYTETQGPYYHCLNIKQAAFFPFVNSIRLLSLKHNIVHVSSTKQRFEALMTDPELMELLKPYYESFLKLLEWRAKWQLQHYPMEYESSHYVLIQELSTEHKQIVKQVVQDGYKLTKITSKILNKD